MTDRLLVTGGAGFIGSHIAARFDNKGWNVRVLDDRRRADETGRDNWAYLDRLHPEIDLRSGDVTDGETVRDAIEGCDAVVHTAGQVAVTRSLETPLADCQTNTVGTLTVLDAADELGTKPAVAFASTNKVYGGHVNEINTVESPARYDYDGRDGIDESVPVDGGKHSPYGVSKLAADLYVQDYDSRGIIDGAAFRMSCIYGPRQYGTEAQGWIAHFIRSVLADEPITIYGDGRQVRDALFIDDCVSAYESFIEAPGGTPSVFNLGGGPDQTVSLLELLEVLADETGTEPTVRFDDWRPGDQRVYISDIGRVQDVLDWQPTVGVREGVRRYIDWMQTHEYTPRA